MAPVFSHGDLRLYLLSLLDEEPRHGYGIIQALSDRTGGTYTPSAGTVYPRLAKLEEEGLVTKTVDGRTTIYTITDAGREVLASRRHELDGIETGLADSVRLIADEVRGSVREAMKSLRADLAAAARDVQSGGSGSTWSPAGSDAGSEGSGSGTGSDSSSGSGSSERRSASREQMHRAEASVNEFRARVRGALRSHVARGGDLDAAVVDTFERTLIVAASELEAALKA